MLDWNGSRAINIKRDVTIDNKVIINKTLDAKMHWVLLVFFVVEKLSTGDLLIQIGRKYFIVLVEWNNRRDLYQKLKNNNLLSRNLYQKLLQVINNS